jgi:hypothetical protein
MTALRLISASRQSIKPLVEAALENELHLMETGIRQTKQRILNFEEKYGMSTAEFISAYRDDKLAETMEFIEWMGESKLLERLLENTA